MVVMGFPVGERGGREKGEGREKQGERSYLPVCLLCDNDYSGY